MSARESIKHSFQCGLRGFHVHKEVWNPIVSEVLRCCHERKNPFEGGCCQRRNCGQKPPKIANCTREVGNSNEIDGGDRRFRKE